MWDKWLAWILYRARMDWELEHNFNNPALPDTHTHVAVALCWWSSGMAISSDYRALQIPDDGWQI